MSDKINFQSNDFSALECRLCSELLGLEGVIYVTPCCNARICSKCLETWWGVQKKENCPQCNVIQKRSFSRRHKPKTDDPLREICLLVSQLEAFKKRDEYFKSDQILEDKKAGKEKLRKSLQIIEKVEPKKSATQIKSKYDISVLLKPIPDYTSAHFPMEQYRNAITLDDILSVEFSK
eukprot:snap_masked-scaffold_20-processed-gene-1.13-mRNA-1 protein AED:1.00 eAED:1.00 QI:0/-1/0/0/-1/1/1/0/177